jgi:hypothetical protein
MALSSAVPAHAQSAGGFPVDPPPAPAPVRAQPAPVAPAPAPAPVAIPRASTPTPAPASPAPVPAAPAAQPAPPAPPSRPLPPSAAPPEASVASAPIPLSPAAPAILPYRDGLPVPPGYHVETRSAGGLIGTGIGMTALGYIVGLGVGVDHHFEGSLGWLVVPVVGAWPAVAGSKITCRAETVEAAKKCLDNAYTQATTIAIVAVDGMVQATGVALLVAGLLSGRSELVRDDQVRVSARRRPEGGFELGVFGRF